MTLSELQTLLGQLTAMDLDNFAGESPSSSDTRAQLNAALRWVSRYIHLFNPKVTLTLTAGTQIYNIQDVTTPIVSHRCIRPLTCMINGARLYGEDRRSYGMWNYGAFIQAFPTWETVDDAAPFVALLYQEGKLILHPTPVAATVSAGNNFLASYVLAADLSASGDVPDIPVDCHEAIACLAAVWASDPQIAEDEALQRVGRYNARAYEALQDTRNTNKNVTALFGNPSIGSTYPDYM